ncbi:MAG: response regulator transcription factor [Clostridioides sp.]|jgi:two-component system response regulator VanR|nr:response regulator transcription factor [Clostridioides sp.]
MLIEDNIDLSDLIKMYLIPEGWEIEIYNTGYEALKLFNENQYDLILLDLLLPDINGFEVCKNIRNKSTIPIIMLTALENTVHKVQGLNIGADDYIIKPFEPTELIARIKSQLRRSYVFSTAKFSVKDEIERNVGKLILNKKTHQCRYDNIVINLTNKEFEILWLLMGEPDNVYSMNEIHYKIWGDQILESEVNPVMVHVRRIRSKFENSGIKTIIKTVWGVGYKINV